MRKIAFVAAFLVASPAVGQPLGLATAPQGTVNFQLATTISKVLSDSAGMSTRVQPLSATGVFIPLVNSGEIDAGFCNTNELYQAFHGVGTFAQRPNPKLRVVADLFSLPTGLLVREGSPYTSVRELRGKTIPQGYTSQETMQQAIEAIFATGGLTSRDVKSVLVPTLNRGIDEFVSGRADAVFYGIGAAKVTEADKAVGGIRFLDLGRDPDAAAAMSKIFETSYMAEVQPAPHYAGVKVPINTMHYDFSIFANADVPPEQVKTIVIALLANRQILGERMALLRGMKPERMYRSLGVPYHEGAVAAYNEAGIVLAK